MESPVVIPRVTQSWASVKGTLYRDTPQGRRAQCLESFIAVENLAEVIIPCRFYLPVAGSGKRLGPRSSDMSSGSKFCNVLKSIYQMWGATQF